MSTKAGKKSQKPLVYQAVRPVWILIPKYNDNSPSKFDISIDVIWTAFWLKNHKVLVTCAHVVQELVAPIEKSWILYVWLSSWEFIQAKISCIDFSHDLAILTIDEKVAEEESVTWLELCEEYPSVWTKIWYAWYPWWNILFLDWEATPTYAEWVVWNQIRDNILRKNIQITWTVFWWFSWWPVVSLENNQLVAVISNSPNSSMWQAGIFMSTSFEHVKAIAELNNS